MKRILMVVLAMCLFVPASIKASDEKVTALSNGFTNVAFDNGYYGYCIDRDLKGAYVDDVFTVSDTNAAISNHTNENIGQKLKLLFVVCFEDLFVEKDNGEYVLDSNIKDTILPKTIYNLTEGQYLSSSEKVYLNKVNAYEGNEIPDNGHKLVLDNGDVITFSFMVLNPNNDNAQFFFAYKISVNSTSEHEHVFSDDFKHNEEEHWKECECGEIDEIGNHEGGKATCISKANCDICGKEYGTIDLTNHTGETEIRNAKDPSYDEEGYTGDTYCKDCDTLLVEGESIKKLHRHEFGDWEKDDEKHWKECECGEIEELSNHEGGKATCISKANCDICGKEYGTFDLTNHTGETEIRNAKDPSYDEEGYTGDTYCKDCDSLLVEGESIEKLHRHEFGDWKKDDEQHWKECECGEIEELSNHEGGEATCISKANCEVCGKEYGTIDLTNHIGETEIRNAKDPSYDEEGYTGDTYCKDCDSLLKNGKVLPKLTNTPNTSDHHQIFLWIDLLVLSVMCYLLVSIKKVRN